MEKKYFLYLTFLYSWEGLETSDSLIDEYIKRHSDENKDEITDYDIQSEICPARLFCDLSYIVETPRGNSLYIPFIGDNDDIFDHELLNQEFEIGEYLLESSPRNGPCCGSPCDYICIYIGDDNSTENLIRLSNEINEIVKLELNMDFNFDPEMIETSDEYIYYQLDNNSHFRSIK